MFSDKLCQDSLLHRSIRAENELIVEQILESDDGSLINYQNKDGKTPLHEAAQLKSTKILTLLLEKDAKVDVLKRGDWTPLMLASAKGNMNVIECLIKAGCSIHLVNKDGWSAFHIACRTGDPQIVHYFIKTNRDILNSVSKNGRTPLHTAALHGHTEVIKILLEQNFYKPDDRDSCGNTPSMDCVRSGNLSAFKLFLKSGVNVNVFDYMGKNLSHLAAETDQIEILDFLVKQFSLDVNSPSLHGQRPIHFAAKEGHLNAVKCLIGLNAEINTTDSQGRTALWLAAGSKKMECYKLLLLHGSQDIADNSGISPSNILAGKQMK